MIPEWKLERYLLGELSPHEAEEISELSKSDDILRMRIQTLQESNAEFLKAHPAKNAFRDIIRSRSRTGSARGLQIAAMITVLLGIMAVAYLKFQPTEIMNGVDEMGSTSGTEVAMNLDQTASGSDVAAGIRIKGLPSRFEVWKKAGDSAIQMQDRDSVIAGDELQIRYTVAEKCFGLLFSMDGNGFVTIHIGQDNNAVELAPQGIKFLPTAYKLDNAPYFEKFFFLTAGEAFSIAPENIDILLQQQNIKQTSLTLIKNGGKQ